MASIKPRVKVPKSVAAGEVFSVKTLINHAMESGQRKGKDGNKIPRKIINKFEASFNGAAVFTADLETAISTNPFIEFSMKINEAGDLAMKWTDDDGSVYETSKSIAIG
jgi:sulfur-oxidizing protein SoxZ